LNFLKIFTADGRCQKDPYLGLSPVEMMIRFLAIPREKSYSFLSNFLLFPDDPFSFLVF